MVGSCFANDPGYTLLSHEEWKEEKIRQTSLQTLTDYSGYMCTTGIIGNVKCNHASMDDIYDANVRLPLEMLHIARLANRPFIAFSSTSIYRNTSEVCKETDDLQPWNRYAASKIAMEQSLKDGTLVHGKTYNKLTILRIPLLVLFDGPHSFGNKVATWEVCEDVHAPVLYRDTLLYAVERVLREPLTFDTYNLYTEVIHLPSFIHKHFGWGGIVMTLDEKTVTPNPQLDVSRAKRDGLIWSIED